MTARKAGTVTWRAQVWLEDDESSEVYARCVAEAEYPLRSLGLAKAFAVRHLRGHADVDGFTPHAVIRRGTYQATDYEGLTVLEWEDDNDSEGFGRALYARLNQDGTVAWDDFDLTTP